MEEHAFYAWICHFVKSVEHVPRPILLLYDGHGSHVSYRILRKAVENGITILKLPPHTSHVLQPLDVGVFRPAKVAWRKILDQFFKQSNFSTVGKAEFPSLLKQLHDSPDAFKKQHAVAGFMKCGVFPLDKSAIDWEKVKPATIVAGHNQKGISNEDSTESQASQTSPVLADNSVTSNSISPCASQPNLNSNLAVSPPGTPPCSSGCPSVQTHSPTNDASIASTSTPTGIPSTATLTPKTLLCKAVCAQLKEMTSTAQGGKVKQKRRRVPKQRGECLTEKELHGESAFSR